MISIVSEPERIVNGETLKVKLDIEGKVNLGTYKNMYFNLTIKKMVEHMVLLYYIH